MSAATRWISSAGSEEGARRLGLCRRAALFPPRRDARGGRRRPIAAARASSTPDTARCSNPLYAAFLEAAQQAGYPLTDDINGGQQEGFGRMDMTVHKGRRWSAANAYLKPAMARPNLRVVTHALASRILFEGRRAVGVAYRRGRHRASRDGAARGDPVGRPDQLAAAAQAVRHRPGGGTARARHPGRRTICPASARTCRTISNSTSRWNAPSRSRCFR